MAFTESPDLLLSETISLAFKTKYVFLKAHFFLIKKQLWIRNVNKVNNLQLCCQMLQTSSFDDPEGCLTTRSVNPK